MTKTVTLGEEIIRDVETYRQKLQNKTGRRVTFGGAFRMVMELALRNLEEELDTQIQEASTR